MTKMTTRRKKGTLYYTCDLINGSVSATSPNPLLLLVVSGSMWACGRRLSNQSMHLGAFWEDYFLISLIWICIWSDFWDCHIREATLKLVGVPKVLSEFCRVLNEFFMMQLFFQLSSKNQDDFGNFYRADYGAHRLTVCFRSIQPGVPVFHWRHPCGSWYLAKKTWRFGFILR